MFRTLIRHLTGAVLALTFGATMLLTPARTEAAPIVFVPPPFDGRIGEVVIHNPYSQVATVALWHPDSRAIFATWTVQPGAKISLLPCNGPPVTVGNDWGLQMNGLHIIPIGKSSFQKRPTGGYVFEVNLFQLYK